MKHNVIVTMLMGVILLTTSSCATLFTKSRKELLFKGVPNTTIYYEKTNTKLGEIQDNGFATLKVRKKLGGCWIVASKDGYNDRRIKIPGRISGPTFLNVTNLLGYGIDAASGKMGTYYNETVDVTLTPGDGRYTPENKPSLVESLLSKQNTQERVTRDNPGNTAMERAIIRWNIDSDPRGARIFWRVISSVPDEVKNTNETYLTTTPYEETRSFNILGLTYENSRDVTIEIKLTKKGYASQVKRFNARQALDQQEISTFFELVNE